MSKQTSIQWAHSTANWQMGCDGCELWIPGRGIFKCYAGSMTRGMEGKKGWPVKFEEPKLFLERVEETLKWGPPTEMERNAKPWIPRDYPRVIFLNDMGDTFSKKLPLNWLAPLLPRMAESKHQFLVLTKRPSSLVQFAERFPLPSNFWPGTTFTADRTAARIDELRKIQTGGPKFVSFEPLWSAIPSSAFDGIAWAIFGGESGDIARGARVTACDVDWIEQGNVAARRAGAAVFNKQLGSAPSYRGQYLPLPDMHGGDWEHWPEHLQIREMPTLSLQHQTDLL